MTFDEYVRHYSQNHRVYWAGGVPWRNYKGTLRPLSLPHDEPKLIGDEVKSLLKQSKARVATWTYDFDRGEAEWWWIVAEPPYLFDNLPSKTRYYVRHGLKHCTVEMTSGKVLADIGYDCYRAAMQRHTQTEPLSEAVFRKNVPNYDGDKLHELWGVFVGSTLAGFATYQIVEDVVDQQDAIFDPAHFKHHSSHALIHTISDYYLNQRKARYITTGMRTISHQTQFEDFVIKNFGYRRAYCRLGVAYSPAIRLLAGFIYRTPSIWRNIRLPAGIMGKLDVIHKLAGIEKSTKAPVKSR
jgi:hypothetical protein